MKKNGSQVSSLFVSFAKVLICLLILSLWSPIIVPILFYLTFDVEAIAVGLPPLHMQVAPPELVARR